MILLSEFLTKKKVGNTNNKHNMPVLSLQLLHFIVNINYFIPVQKLSSCNAIGKGSMNLNKKKIKFVF